MIERQVVQMTRLLEDLLDVSRLSRAQDRAAARARRAGARIEQALEATRPLMRSRRPRARSSNVPRETRSCVDADLTRLTQVFANLLNNAAKYTEPGGRIEIDVQPCDGERVAVQVRDNGIGIAPELLPHVFDMFSQARLRASGARRAGHRAGPGARTGRAARRRRSKSRARGRDAAASSSCSLPIAAAARTASDPERPDAPALPRLRMLVVDDNVDAAQSLAAVLALEGQDVRTAYSVEHALHVADVWAPQVACSTSGCPTVTATR